MIGKPFAIINNYSNRMATLKLQLEYRFLLVAAATLLLSACNDGRIAKAQPLKLKQVFQNNSPTLSKVASVQFENGETTVDSIVREGNTLYMVGRPFGFSGWAIDQPDTPTLTFDIKAQLTTFAIKLPWVYDWYASGAVGIMGSTAFLSGTAGVSVVNLTQSQAPKEIFRKPPLDASGNPQRDFAYTYRAVVPHPSGGMYYGFSQQESVYTVAIRQNDLQVISRASYSPNGNVCCVRSATLFANTIYVAFGTRMAWFAPTANGGLVDPGELNELQVAGVARSETHLIAYHNPSSAYASGQVNPRGFYYFDSTGQLEHYVPTNLVPKIFATDATGRYIYVQTAGGTEIEIHRVSGL